MASRAGLINRLITVLLFSGYVTYVVPRFGTSFWGNVVIFGSLTIFAFGLSRFLADKEDRMYLVIAALGLILPIIYFTVLFAT